MAHSALVVELASAIAVVNTSSFEGMPNTFLEAWGQGVPVLSFSFDPDNLIQEKGLGIAADGVWDTFVAGARRLWAERFERSDLSARTRSYIRDVHSPEAVGSQWEALLGELGVSASPALDL